VRQGTGLGAAPFTVSLLVCPTSVAVRAGYRRVADLPLQLLDWLGVHIGEGSVQPLCSRLMSHSK
jgi:hypothetical protein